MKTTRFLPLLASVVLVAGCQTATPAPKNDRITVTFDHPDKFTDAKSTAMGGTDEGYLEDLKSHLELNAPRYLAEGQRLAVKFTDLDMAGDHEPWRREMYDVRIVKEIYMPRLKFSYAVTDAAGATVSQGEENLTDMNYLMRVRLPNDHDPLFFEKSLLDDWMKTTLPPKPAAPAPGG